MIDDQTDPENPVVLEEEPGVVRRSWSEAEYEYALTLPGTAGTCVDYTNTAIVDLTQGQDPTAEQDGDRLRRGAARRRGRRPPADLARAYAWSVAKVGRRDDPHGRRDRRRRRSATP